MKIIRRELYVPRLINVDSAPDIKVITGVRRAGKSTLLDTFKSEIAKKSNVNIIHIDFNLRKNDSLSGSNKLHDYVESCYKKDSINYLLIDEIQDCNGFEKSLNYLHATQKYHIYVTGSNAFLTASDLSTLFVGRTFPIPVFPFSFKEFTKYYSDKKSEDLFEDYLIEGGMAGSYLYDSLNSKYEYIKNTINSLIVRDIVTKYRIQYPSILDNIIDFLFDNVGKITSVRNIANILKNENKDIDHKTVGSYIKYLCNSFLFYQVRRYDIKGKKYLSTSAKYYIADHAMKFARLGTRNIDRGRTLENIVAIELLRRGYDIYVGVFNNYELDFVANKFDEQIYIQVCDTIANDDILLRESRPLLNLKNGYKKIIITNNYKSFGTYEGIEIIDIRDWLLKE